MIGLLGGFMVVEGLVLLVHGLMLGLGPLPFYVDTAFCLLIGAGILMGWCEMRKKCQQKGPIKDYKCH